MDDKKAERPRNPNDTFQVGQPRPEIPRRTKGAPTNKLATLDIHHAILEAANRVGSDGRGTGGLVGYLESAARKHPKYFLSLIGRMVSLDINESDESEGPININIVSIPSGHFFDADGNLRAPGATENEPVQVEAPIDRIEEPIEQTDKPVEAVQESLGASGLRLVRSRRLADRLCRPHGSVAHA